VHPKHHGRGAALSCGEPASVAALDHGRGEDGVADVPVAVGYLLGKDHGVGACFLAVDLGVPVGGAVDDEFLLLGGQGTSGHFEVREWHDGGFLGGGFAGWSEACAGGQELGDADAVVELGPDAVVDGGDGFAAVAAGVDAGRSITRTILLATSAGSWPSGKMPARFWPMTSRSLP
jgi:hypothetical protein